MAEDKKLALADRKGAGRGNTFILFPVLIRSLCLKIKTIKRMDSRFGYMADGNAIGNLLPYSFFPLPCTNNPSARVLSKTLNSMGLGT